MRVKLHNNKVNVIVNYFHSTSTFRERLFFHAYTVRDATTKHQFEVLFCLKCFDGLGHQHGWITGPLSLAAVLSTDKAAVLI